MTKNESQLKPSFTSSAQMDNSLRSEAILTLGHKLVEELGLEHSTDTLGRWMAHYLSELIEKSKNETGNEKQLAGKNCFDTILALWKHLAELSTVRSPFKGLEPIIRVIESLDPNGHIPRYYPSARPPQRQGEEKNEVDRWLNLVSSIDNSAKILIGYYLAEAARAAVDKSEEWVKLAEAAGAADSTPKIVIRFISDNADLCNQPDPNAEVRQQLQERIRRLEDFISKAKAVADDLKTRLESLPPSHNNSVSSHSSHFKCP